MKAKPKKNTVVLSKSRRQLVNHIYAIAATGIIAVIFNYYSGREVGLVTTITLLVTAPIWFYSAQYLNNGSIRGVYLGSSALLLVLVYIYIYDNKLFLYSLILPIYFYSTTYGLWKSGELK
ncbi:MAG TPA: hypothetical protein DCX53_01075 [Anaerolineae bacterium]|nr:hypothetical protein [Anaerolineae bacterium]